MKHVTYSDKSLLVGDIAADLLMRYAAALANTNGADTVDIRAIGSDGADVVATFLLDAGAPMMAETSTASVKEPDNAEAEVYMRERMQQLSSFTRPVVGELLDDELDEEFNL